MPQNGLLEMIEVIYAAAADPECWSQVLDDLVAQYRDARGAITRHDTKVGSGSYSVTSANWDADWIAAYNDYYSALNPWLRNIRKRPVGLVIPPELLFDRASLVKTEFYNDFMRPQKFMTGAGVTIHQDRDRFISIGVVYPPIEDETANIELLQRLVPHFRRAMQVNHKLANASLVKSAAETGLHQLSLGLLIIDAAGRSIFHNRAAELILAQNDGIHLDREGRIETCSVSETTALRNCITAALRVLDRNAEQSGGSFKINRPSRSHPYTVLVAPIRPPHKAKNALDARAVLMIRDNAAGSLVPACELSAAFGITKAEARVLKHLIDGRTVAEASDVLGISVMTARTHLKRMFAKLDCSSQSDLVRNVVQHPMWILSRD